MSVSGLGEFALGQAVPNREHAVCVSIPTMSDLVGYEKKDPRTISQMDSGYPRFVEHRLIRKLIQLEEKKTGNGEKKSFLFANNKHCQKGLRQFSIKEFRIIENEEYICLQLPKGSAAARNISSFVQHTGGTISSRLAESVLVNSGCFSREESISPKENPEQFAREVIAQVHGSGVSQEKILICSSGANAFYSLFYIAYRHFHGKGKTIWIRLGWLYLDTIETMEMVSNNENEIITLTDLQNPAELESVFSRYGSQIAGVVTEFPTNPLLQSCDLEKVRQLCKRVNALLIIDPTMASPKNAKVAQYGDVLVNSLTKYASWAGDVMIGSLVFPDHSELGAEIFESTKILACPPFERDLLRLCEQLPHYTNFVERTNHSLFRVVDFLNSNPLIKKVYWAYQDEYSKSFHKIAGDEKGGCVVSFEVKGNFESFYNHLKMLKSPSFGTEFSLCCPYVYLAHFDLIQSTKGMDTLQSAGISPYLCRLSVGLEDPDEIIECLRDALQKMDQANA